MVCLQTKGEVLGRLRGVSVKMLMHHSRNSEQKQWDETLVLALSGMGRLLRAHLPLLVPMQAFPQVLLLFYLAHSLKDVSMKPHASLPQGAASVYLRPFFTRFINQAPCKPSLRCCFHFHPVFLLKTYQ